MKNLIVNKKVVRVYDSIDEMPIVNFQKYNKYLLIDSGIGSDADDIDAHITRVAKFIKSNNAKKALQELQNMRQNIYKGYSIEKIYNNYTYKGEGMQDIDKQFFMYPYAGIRIEFTLTTRELCQRYIL